MRIFGDQLMGGEKAKNAQAVIHGNNQHALAGEVFAVLTRLRGGAADKPATINPDHHRQFRFFAFDVKSRRPNVEGEAVLALARIAEDHVVERFLLHTAEAEASSLAHPIPLSSRLRGLPTQAADRGHGIRDPQEVSRLAIRAHLSLDLPMVSLYYERI